MIYIGLKLSKIPVYILRKRECIKKNIVMFHIGKVNEMFTKKADYP
ncbi:hypothetical protein IWQ47_004750 [Aquimarina sp. EL_43]|nr:hypothetical protein [Aquimarina sp. EL_35]MBG6153498.1 hypothetical protein [Aquimarina sp. EL_32]MBG6171654.1 hypothetical protein [Aquimarina sp. EL_43]